MVPRSWIAACLLAALIVAGITNPALADENVITVAADEGIAIEVLEAKLGVLTPASLEATAAAWQIKVEKACFDLVEAETAATPNPDTIAGLTKTRDDLLARFDVVTAALTGAGGDATAYEAYADSFRGSAMDDLTNYKEPSKILLFVKDWVVSPDGGIKWATKIILFILTLIAFKILASIIGKIVGKAVSGMKNTSRLLKDFFVNTVRKLVFFVGIIVALSMIDVNIGPFVAAIGAVGFVIAFALQGTLSNFASGIMILLYRPYDIGDVVNISGVTGKVDAMTLVSTTVKTPDNQVVIVPNSSIWGGIITNITGSDTRRVDLVFGIGYSDDIQKSTDVMEKVLASHELILKDPEPVIKVHELADSSVNFVVRPWVKTSDYWTVYWDVTRAVKERFDEEGISIPFPQRDVHMHNVEA